MEKGFTDKKDSKASEKRELEVLALAKAFAIANGHSHPDDYAKQVASVYVEPGDVAEARREEDARREQE